MAGAVSAEEILDADSGDSAVVITDTDATATVPGWEETTQGEMLAGWAAVIMVTEEASREVTA